MVLLGVVVLVFVIVRLRSVPPAVEPSMVTRLAPIVRIIAFEEVAPVILRGPPLGLIKTVNGDANWFSPTSPVSPTRSLVILIVMLPVTSLLLMNSNTPPAFVSDVKVSPVPTLKLPPIACTMVY